MEAGQGQGGHQGRWRGLERRGQALQTEGARCLSKRGRSTKQGASGEPRWCWTRSTREPRVIHTCRQIQSTGVRVCTGGVSLSLGTKGAQAP